MTLILASLVVMTAQLSADTLWVTIDSADVPLTAIEDLRIGSIDDTEESTFGYIVSVVESEDGKVVIADQRPGAIRVFDTSGAYLHDIGRKGDDGQSGQACAGEQHGSQPQGPPCLFASVDDTSPDTSDPAPNER